MMKRKRRGQKGFSLMELTVASAIAVGMSLTCALVFRTGIRGWQVSESYTTASFETRRGVHAMARELAQTRSNQLEVQTIAGGPWVEWPAAALTAGTSFSSIRFRVPEIVAPNTTVLDAAGAVTWSVNPITYDLGGVSGQELQRTQTGAAVTPLTVTSGVTALSFVRRAATSLVLEMTVTVQPGAANGAQPVVLSTRIRLRN